MFLTGHDRAWSRTRCLDELCAGSDGNEGLWRLLHDQVRSYGPLREPGGRAAKIRKVFISRLYTRTLWLIRCLKASKSGEYDCNHILANI